jgi:hypothetical protein
MNEVTITDAYDLGELLRLALVRVAELERLLVETLDTVEGNFSPVVKERQLRFARAAVAAAVRQEKP